MHDCKTIEGKATNVHLGKSTGSYSFQGSIWLTNKMEDEHSGIKKQTILDYCFSLRRYSFFSTKSLRLSLPQYGVYIIWLNPIHQSLPHSPVYSIPHSPVFTVMHHSPVFTPFTGLHPIHRSLLSCTNHSTWINSITIFLVK